MRFMMIVKSAERSGFPPKELMEAIGKLSEEAVNAGTMLGTVGSPHRRWVPESGSPAGSSP
jgi:hypothetical protein